MKRALIPGAWNVYGRAIPDTKCLGNCNQGRTCTCDTELANTMAPNSEFPTPGRTREDDAYRARALRRTLAAALGAWAAFAFLLWVAAHASGN
jgi:hypothetical protein